MPRQQDQQQFQLGVWRDLVIDNWGEGGVVLDIDSELLDKSELVLAQNAILRGRKIKTDSGYVGFRQSGLLGNPRKVVEWIDSIGVVQRLLITATTVYRDKNNEWQYVAGGGGNTTLNGAHVTGATNLTVASSANFTGGDVIGIALTNGLQHRTTVVNAPDGTHINITVGLPSGASNGAAVIEPPLLGNAVSVHTVAAQIPWSPDNVVFANGLNPVKIYTAAGAGSIADLSIGGFPIVARTLAFYDNSLVLANTEEAGVSFPNRIKASAKGDLTLWSTLEAVTIDVLDGLGSFQQLLKLGPYLIGYRENGITRISISGSLQKRFTIDPGVIGCGVWSSTAAVDFTDKHAVFGKDKFFLYRGGNAYEEIPCPIKEDVFDPASIHRYLSQRESHSIPVRKFNEVIFTYGFSTTPGPSPRYHLDSGKWTHRKFGNGNHLITGWGERVGTTGLSDGNLFLCVGSPLNQVMEYNYTQDNDAGEDLTFQIVTKDFAQPGYIIKVDWCEISVTANSQVFTVEYSLDKGTTWTTLLNTVPIGTGANVFRMNKQFSGRTVRFRFTQTGRCQINWFNMRHCYDAEW